MPSLDAKNKHVPGGVYHLILSQACRPPILLTKASYGTFETLAAKAIARCRCQLLAYSWNPVEAHLVVRVERVPIARLMPKLMGWRTCSAVEKSARKARVFTQYRYLRIDGVIGLEELMRVASLRTPSGNMGTHSQSEVHSVKALQHRRRKAARLLSQGVSTSQVADRLGVSIRSVQIWAAQLRDRGRRGLELRGSQSKSMITQAQCRVLGRILAATPQASGFKAERWSCSQVATVLERELGLRYTRAGVWYLLRRTNLIHHLAPASGSGKLGS